MTYPLFPKEREPSFVSPAEALAHIDGGGAASSVPPPAGVILCYQRSLWQAVTNDPDAAPHPLANVRILGRTGGRVGVSGGFGVGAPAACLALEALIAYGATSFVSVGTAGALLPDLAIGDLILNRRALRDEGTSYHYLPAARYATAGETLTARLAAGLAAAGLPYREGASWTLDAPYRETQAEVRAYAAEGIAAVEMEAAALFAVGAYRGVEVGSLLTISDSLAGARWDAHFRSEIVAARLQALYEVAVAVLGRKE